MGIIHENAMKLHTDISDKVLVSQLRERSNWAFNEIFERYSRVLYVYAKKLVKDQIEAEDLIQDIFTSLWDNAEELEINGSLSAYLYSAVRYKFLNLVAKHKVRSDYVTSFQILIDEGTLSTDDYINEKELISLVEKQVAKLPAKMREVFELSRNEGLMYQQIAFKLNISEKTVKNHINHALKILRSKFPVLVILIYLSNR